MRRHAPGRNGRPRATILQREQLETDDQRIWPYHNVNEAGNVRPGGKEIEEFKEIKEVDRPALRIKLSEESKEAPYETRAVNGRPLAFDDDVAAVVHCRRQVACMDD